MQAKQLVQIFLIVLTVAAAGCASTTLTNSWRAPDFDRKVTSMVVVGVSKQASVRRIFEDEFATQLRNRGIRAVSSYTLIPEDGQVEQDRLRAAVESAGTDGVIITRLVRVENKVAVSNVAVPPPYPYRHPYYYGYYSGAWVGYYEPVSVHQYDIVTAETTVFVRDRAEPVWSGTTETFAPEDIKKETAKFSEVVIKALAKEGLI